MLFHLVMPAGVSPAARAVIGLDHLAFAGINGFQFVSGDRGALEAIADDERLRPESRAFYRRMAQVLTQVGRVLADVDRITVNVSEEGPGVNGDVVPVGVFSNPDLCEKTQFLVENITDFEVLTCLASALNSAVYKGFNLSLRAHNGGGSTTPQVLEHLTTVTCGPVLCIVDSDRRFPGAGLGATALTTQRAYQRAVPKWRVRFHVIDARELENLIPLDLRDRATEPLAANVKGQADVLNGVSAEFLKYCCLKGGDSTCRMLSDAIRRRHYGLIAAIGAFNGNGLQAHEPCGTCATGNRCFASPALGIGFLQRVAEILKGGGPTAVASWSLELRDLVEKVSMAGLALEPQRV